VIDIFGIADKDRPEISVLSDEFLDSITKRTEHPNVPSPPAREAPERRESAAARGAAKIAGQSCSAREVRRGSSKRYELKQLTSAEVVERPGRDCESSYGTLAGRYEQLGLTREEAGPSMTPSPVGSRT